MLYQAYQAHADWLMPAHFAARAAADAFGLARLPRYATLLRRWVATCEMFSTLRITHRRPAFGIDSVRTGEGDEVPVTEEAVAATPFATLVRFLRPPAPAGRPPLPKVLIAAPMSGHFATLLRDTVRVMLTDHDVYVTDWHSARDVPLSAGRFGLDEYTAHLIEFLAAIGEGSNLMAICQPCVASLAAVALMSEEDHPATPKSLTLMAGPIDCRISPTTVNQLATAKPIEWFEKKLISRVPWRHAGGGRRVYPGFLQLMAFMNMNRERHLEAFRQMYAHLLADEMDKVAQTRAFYDEYFAVSDLPAEFYLETVQRVFQEYALPQGRLTWRERAVDPRALRRTALLTVEGERDDICAPGQTLAAQDLCTGLRPYMRTHYVQPGVGHYGVFSGKRWASQIYPVVRDTIHVSQ